MTAPSLALAAPSLGRARPRIAPPLPARSDLAGLRTTAGELGFDLMPWQETAGRYLEGLAADGRHLYREVAIVVARQNGKTTLLVPLIVKRVRAGRRIIHTAQNRELPREVFGEVADILADDQSLFPQRNGRRTKPRFANGQEEVRLANGGLYRIVAPTRGGARGHPGITDVIIDELREMDTWDFIAAAKPTTSAAPDPQVIYLSNAGDDTSIVLNALRSRAADDPALAYLEWSAGPDRGTDDPVGWAEANPAMGHEREGMGSLAETLTTEHRTAAMEGTLRLFETEHLCRWVTSMREPLLEADAWAACEVPALGSGRRIYMGVSMDPDGTRASAALAWQRADGTVALRMLYDVTGDPISTAALGKDLADEATRRRVSKVAFDPMTDAELAKFFRVSDAVSGRRWANASALFVNLVAARRLAWHDAAAVGDDLAWTARKEATESGSFAAVRAKDDRPITAVLAAIRAVWLASGPRPAAPRVY